MHQHIPLRHRLAWFSLILAGCIGTPAQSLGADPNSGEASAEPVITANAGRSADTQIRQRISNIYSALEELSSVTVIVNSGVVTLSGSVANDNQAARATALAERVEGVVTVEDDIERTLDVQSNVAPILEEIKSRVSRWLRASPLYLAALLVCVGIAWLSNHLAGYQDLWRRLTPNSFLADLLAQLLRVVGLALGITIGLTLIGADAMIGTILGSAGLIGIAIGFAVRDTLENYIASIMLSIRQPFRAQEHLQINDHEGIVVRLTSRATVLMTLDGNHLRIPNADVFKAVIVNYTRNPERRMLFELGIDAEDDPMQAIMIGVNAANDLPFILKDPEPSAIIGQVGDSNIVLEFRAWIDQRHSDFGKARSLAICAVKDALEAAGFTLPEPIYRLRVDSLPELTMRDSASGDTSPPANPTPPVRTQAQAIDPTAGAELDVAPDLNLQEKVAEERQHSEDLLNDDAPEE